MAYTKNPNLPKVRMEAVRLVKYRKRSPKALPIETVEAIIKERVGRRRCAEHVHHALKKKGVNVSLSSVKRTLDRCNLRKKRRPWKRPHDFTKRPEASFCGALLELDTIHIIAPDGSRIYVYTIIDLFSRWAYAEVVPKIGTVQTVALGELGSIAPLLYLMGDHRVITPETTLWFHHVGRKMDGIPRVNTLEAERMRKELLIDEGKYFRIIEERTDGKTSRKEAMSLLRNEKTLNAKEAVKLGFAHEIVSVNSSP